MNPPATIHAPQPLSLFVTGTDTEIGKTLIACALLHGFAGMGLSSAAMKPIAAGAFQDSDGQWRNEDTDQLDAAASVALPPEIRTPYLFKEPCAPHLAAAHTGVVMDMAHIIACHAQAARRADVVIVEGVGGFRVPLNDRYDSADLACALKVPVVLVVGIRLGCLNHALLTAEAIAARGLQLIGWVANCMDASMRYMDDNIDTLHMRLARTHDAPLIGRVPHLSPATPARAAKRLNIAALLNA